ncbi:Iron-regulated ABC transporter permease protein SufD [Cyclonatronum proteinivorum]|uniref:Iron-regulated ABC transporter permease protein SufD n=1 Tax=Cyclonatronum proteinivorum TaxID=1457365 RepID=A0A345UK47_9BACT|nr:Fe-S cluster assembly protein SufD [Cyclonatronum proteinivorum]AXJ00849.1 Iron-regulated ABC transporter permease protein SufD [Cyclonatronum proteinivorum]
MSTAVQFEQSTYLNELHSGFSVTSTGVAPVETAREKAVKNVQEWSFPTPRDEDWRQLSLKPLYRNAFVQPSAAEITAEDVSDFLMPESAKSTLVLLNGVLVPALSETSALPEGCYAGSVKNAPEFVVKALETHFGNVARYERDAFTAFNTAVLEDVIVVYTAKDVKVEAPLHILNLTDARSLAVATAPRVFIFGERFSDATVVEDFIGLGTEPYFNTAVSETVLEDEAHVNHIKVQRENRNAIHISRVASLLGRGSNYNSYTVSSGALLFRNEPLSLVDAENAHATLDGLVMVDGNQVSDTHSTLDHLKANCTSHQLHKVIALGEGKSVFNGKIFVRKDSQQIDAFQENRNLLLSETADVFTKPQLEIFADDVKCSHGATIGQLSDEELFYMRSRGLSRKTAVQMLTYGYALDVIENIPVESLREQLTLLVADFTGNEAVPQA